MAHPSTLKVAPENSASSLFEGSDTFKKIQETHSREIVIALCGPIGAPIREVAAMLQEILGQKYEYDPQLIKLSEFIEEYKGKAPTDPDKFKRYDYLIKCGGELRHEHSNSILSELAVKQISIRRAQSMSEGQSDPKPVRFCHIIDSLKRTEEIELLRVVYGKLFVLIGVHSSPEDRGRRLKNAGVAENQISNLMDTDSGEDFAHGQEVRKAFPLADFFVHAADSNTSILKKNLERILQLITKSRIVTPTQAETAMYHAHAASLNSACLSRQVGAAVTDTDGNILGLGWNDVPKFDGGLYAEGSGTDHRCMHREGGRCFNDFEKDVLAELIAKAVGEIIPSAKTQVVDIKKAIKESRIKDLIEFSRAVHAEMMAIIAAGAAANGQRIRGGKIFVTTYPCHSCARHILAAGLHEVIFIEPYRKSLAIRLHSDAISEQPDGQGKLKITPFEGVGPSRYADFFEKRQERKDKSGTIVTTKTQNALFTGSMSLSSLPALEGLIVDQLKKRELVSLKDDGQQSA